MKSSTAIVCLLFICGNDPARRPAGKSENQNMKYMTLLFALMFALILVSPVFAQTQMQCHPIVNGAQLASDELVIGDMVCRKLQPSASGLPASAPPIIASESSPRVPRPAERSVAKADTPIESTNTPIKAADVRPTTIPRRDSAPPNVVLLEDATPVHLVLSENLSSASAVTGQTVEFEVVDDIVVNDLLLIPRGSTAWATVTEAEHKRRLGRGGKLNLNIDKVRLADGEKALLRGVKDTQGGGHTGAMTGAIVATSLVVWPAAPLFLFMHGKDINIPKGTQITAFTQGDERLDATKFQKQLGMKQ
jgi:hypothetical protein